MRLRSALQLLCCLACLAGFSRAQLAVGLSSVEAARLGGADRQSGIASSYLDAMKAAELDAFAIGPEMAVEALIDLVARFAYGLDERRYQLLKPADARARGLLSAAKMEFDAADPWQRRALMQLSAPAAFCPVWPQQGCALSLEFELLVWRRARLPLPEEFELLTVAGTDLWGGRSSMLLGCAPHQDGDRTLGRYALQALRGKDSAVVPSVLYAAGVGPWAAAPDAQPRLLLQLLRHWPVLERPSRRGGVLRSMGPNALDAFNVLVVGEAAQWQAVAAACEGLMRCRQDLHQAIAARDQGGQRSVRPPSFPGRRAEYLVGRHHEFALAVVALLEREGPAPRLQDELLDTLRDLIDEPPLLGMAVDQHGRPIARAVERRLTLGKYECVQFVFGPAPAPAATEPAAGTERR